MEQSELSCHIFPSKLTQSWAPFHTGQQLGGKFPVAGACWSSGLYVSASLMSGACWQVELSERYSAASESGSSTEGHPETAETTKDGKSSPWE